MSTQVGRESSTRRRSRWFTRLGLPEGQIFHAAGPSADGWVILAVFDARESWERYVDDVLTPEFTAGIEGTFPPGYNAIEFDVEVLEP